jgi:hypothetical protein
MVNYDVYLLDQSSGNPATHKTTRKEKKGGTKVVAERGPTAAAAL